MNIKTLTKSIAILFVVVSVVSSGFIIHQRVNAATTITVNSTADSSANDGVCTLREAITAANNDTASGAAAGECAAGSGAGDTINFSITGAGPHTIQPTSVLPTISQPVVINGCSEPDAVANTAVAPDPFNGTIAVEIDGQNAGAGVIGLQISAGSTTVRCLAINRFTQDGIYLSTNGGNTIVGNYIGTSTSGSVDQGNAFFGINIADSSNNTIGGTAAADRNIISGNNDDGICNCNEGADNNVFLGNYVGINAAGTGDLGQGSDGILIQGGGDNNIVGGTTTGSINVISGNDDGGVNVNSFGDGGANVSEDNSVLGNYVGTNYLGTGAVGNTDYGIATSQGAADTIIGGTSSAARNVVSGNTAIGIAVFDSNTTNTVIRGNYIGVDTTGIGDLGNGTQGINSAGTGSIIGGTAIGARNIIAGNSGNGINSTGNDISIIGNYVGVGSDGTTALSNGSAIAGGIAISGNNGVIGGTTAAARNVISSTSSNSGLAILAGSGNVAQGNYIGTDANGNSGAAYKNDMAGVAVITVNGQPTNNLIGGTSAGAGNLITNNGAGVIVLTVNGTSPLNNSILGNSIHSNSGGSLTSLGIDLAETTNFVSFTGLGVTANDSNDPDTGPNNYMNFPVISSVSSSNGQATITYSLDINPSETGATGYRVEFFANDSGDASGNGEGQTYIGSDTVSGDVTNRATTITLPAGVSGTKYITAVTTMTDASTDGFGHSSEFSAYLQANLVAASSSNSSTSSVSDGSTGLADTGDNAILLTIFAILLLAVGSFGLKFTLPRQA